MFVTEHLLQFREYFIKEVFSLTQPSGLFIHLLVAVNQNVLINKGQNQNKPLNLRTYYLNRLNKELENIIKSCQQKDIIAQKELYEFFSPKMYGVCLRYAGNPTDAEDILQEGFLKVFEKIHQFQFKGSFEGWIRRIIVNTALERFRQQYKIINIQDSAKELSESESENITGSLTAEELLKMIQELSPKYRMVFNMYAIEGYSHKEIADKLNISEGTSKSNLSRARTILQEKVKLCYNADVKIGV